MDYCVRSLTRISISTIFLIILLSSFSFTFTEAYDAHDPDGNITIKWDVLSWTSDGYIAHVTIYNFQRYRYISPPGWTLGWTWAKKEVIWSISGGQTTEPGNCSRYKKALIPQSCKKTPTVVDLLPTAPYNQQVANCCKGGVISVRDLDPDNYISSFQIVVGESGSTNKTVKVPKNFTLLAPGPGYTCGVVVLGRPTKFISPDGTRITLPMMTWNVTCTYSQFLAGKPPPCCSSLFSSYNGTFIPCDTCTCGCRDNVTHVGVCVKNTSYADGDNCVMPPINTYQDLSTNATSRLSFSLLALLTKFLAVIFSFI